MSGSDRPDSAWSNLKRAPVVRMLLPLMLLVAGCAGSPEGSVRIAAFEPPSGTYRAGDTVVSTLEIKNTGAEDRTFWIGYSVRDETGRWHDSPARRVSLQTDEESEPQSGAWEVPDNPSPPSGPYEVVMAVWSGRPGAEGSVRLAEVRRKDAFRVVGLREGFRALDTSLWQVPPAKNLGRSRLDPENVSVEGGRLRLETPAGTLEGGEIESRDLYQYGSYRARIKVADAPSSITGFFLYREPDFENEIDIEIHNDPEGRILFTTYAGGRETNNVEKDLPFDPTADFHEYRFDLGPEKARFYVDGKLYATFRNGLPKDPMRLLVNSWFPTWLPGEGPATDSYTYVDWVRQYDAGIFHGREGEE